MNDKYFIYNTSLGLFKNGEGHSFKEAQEFSLEEAKDIINGHDELEIINIDQRKEMVEKDHIETMVYELGNMLCNLSILSKRAEEVIQKCFVDYVNRLLDYYNPCISDNIIDYYKVFARRFGKEIKEVKKATNDENMF